MTSWRVRVVKAHPPQLRRAEEAQQHEQLRLCRPQPLSCANEHPVALCSKKVAKRMAAEPLEEAGLRETKRKRTKPRPKVVEPTMTT